MCGCPGLNRGKTAQHTHAVKERGTVWRAPEWGAVPRPSVTVRDAYYFNIKWDKQGRTSAPLVESCFDF